jgi:gliding-associated putative ABC transporter substrate-binding component GldG
MQYGARVNANLIQDRQCTHINVPYGDGFVPRPWPFNPVINNFNRSSIISRNLDAIETKFVSSIDTLLSPGIKKTFLLYTSENSRFLRAGAQISYKIVQFPPDESQYDKPELPVAVLLEGEFESAFSRRKLLVDELVKLGIGNGGFQEKSPTNAMIIIGDGDIIRNYVDSDGNIYPLGLNNIERYVFSNKDFLLNCIDYLSGNTGIIEPRSKKLKLRPLDPKKVADGRFNWQLINLAVPLILLYLFSGVYNFIRIRKYSSN